MLWILPKCSMYIHMTRKYIEEHFPSWWILSIRCIIFSFTIMFSRGITNFSTASPTVLSEILVENNKILRVILHFLIRGESNEKKNDRWFMLYEVVYQCMSLRHQALVAYMSERKFLSLILLKGHMCYFIGVIQTIQGGSSERNICLARIQY